MNIRNILDKIGITIMPLNKRNIGLTILILVYVFLWGIIITFSFATTFNTNNQSIEIRQFEDEQHMYDIALAFKIELDSDETLYVERYFAGGWQEKPSLTVVIECIESADSFISRLHDNLDGIGTITPIAYSPLFVPNVSETYGIIVFNEDSDIRAFNYGLTFFNDDYSGISARLNLAYYNSNTEEFTGIFNTLLKYSLSEHTPPELKILWRSWKFSDLLSIQAVLTVFFWLLLYVRK